MDWNIDSANTAWFRFQADTGLQAAWTDPINPLFDSVSPQPLYSFAAGYTHVFSPHVINYFNPGFSWYSSLFAPSDFQKTLAAFPIVLEPYLTQVNGYQTVCPGYFAPFPYVSPADTRHSGAIDPRFGAVTQFSTGANSHYNGLQLAAMKRLGHGLQGQVNCTFSRCMDEVSNGGFLQFSAGAILSPLPGELRRNSGPCDYDVRHNLDAQYVYQLPLKTKNRQLGYALNGWQVSGTVFWHSGLPFSVLSAPYSAPCAQNPQLTCGIVQGGGPEFASVVPGVDPYCRHCNIPGVTQPGTIQWLNPDAFVSAVDPSTGACYGGDSPQTCQFGNSGRNAFRGSNFFWARLEF